MESEETGYGMAPPVPGDDTFEQDLRDMLRDGAVLNDSEDGRAGASSGPMGQFTGVDLSTPPRLNPQGKPLSTNIMVNPHDSSTRTRQLQDEDDIFGGSSAYMGGGSRVGSPGNESVIRAGTDGSGMGAAAPRPKLMHNSRSKVDQFKDWSLSTFKCTRQLLSEKFGKGSKTVDIELEAKIEVLRDTQRKYANILKLSKAMTSHFFNVIQSQRALGEAFNELANRSPELQEEFNYNYETQKNLAKNGDTLLGALNFFSSSVSTLCNKTIEDTLSTVKQYEIARIEYDAWRSDLETLQLAPRDAATYAKLDEAKQKYDQNKLKFDQLRQDVAVKLQFLEENRVKVMQKQLLLFHNAISAYFSGNEKALDSTMKQFNIKVKVPSEQQPSFLEKEPH